MLSALSALKTNGQSVNIDIGQYFFALSMSVAEITIRKHNKSQYAHSRGNLLYKSWPAGDTGRTDTEALSIMFNCWAQGLQGRALETGLTLGVGTDRGPVGDAHFLRRTGGAAGDTGIMDGFLYCGSSPVVCGSLRIIKTGAETLTHFEHCVHCVSECSGRSLQLCVM